MTYTEQELSQMSNAQLRAIIPFEWRPFFPGKEYVEDAWVFYLYDDMEFNILTGKVE